jgi:hypothetical protein
MISHDKGPLFEGRTSVGGVDGKWIAGIALIAIGGILLVAQFTNSTWTGLLIFPALALIFLAWGIAARSPGLMVPAGIFIGLGLGTWLVTGDWLTSNMVADTKGGIFLLAFAVGWASITLLSALFTREVHWWPLIPGGIMAIVGVALVIGGNAVQTLAWLNYAWPLAMIVIGVFLLLRRAGSIGSNESGDTVRR